MELCSSGLSAFFLSLPSLCSLPLLPEAQCNLKSFQAPERLNVALPASWPLKMAAGAAE